MKTQSNFIKNGENLSRYIVISNIIVDQGTVLIPRHNKRWKIPFPIQLKLVFMPRTGRNFEGKRHAKGGMPLFFDFDCYFFSFIGRWTLDALVI